MDIDENWSGWRPEDKRWIEAIISCTRTVASAAMNDHILNIIEKVKQQRIKTAQKGKSEGSGGFMGYE